MTVSIELPAELERRLIERARQSGESAAEHVRRMVERELTRPSLDDVLAPLRDEVEASGVTEDELDELVEQARAARHRERRAERGE